MHPRRRGNALKLLIQPGDGVSRLLKGIKKAKKSVEIVIFRFDQDEVERALVEAVGKGVFVHALIAFTNRGGEEHLRRLEMHLLAKGVSVARTAGDLVRYHGKMMLVDRKELYFVGFQLHAPRHRSQPQFWAYYTKSKAGAGGGQALRHRYQTTELHGRILEVSGQSRKRSQGTRQIPERREERTSDL